MTEFDYRDVKNQSTNQPTSSPPLPHCPWGGRYKKHIMSNTCIKDNFLYLLFVLIQNYANIRDFFQAASGEIPTAGLILNIVDLFQAGQWAEGKFNTFHVVPVDIDLFGTEIEFLSCTLCHCSCHVQMFNDMVHYPMVHLLQATFIFGKSHFSFH